MSSSRRLTFKIHPLAIVNIFEHYTRLKIIQPGRVPRVFGCVIGVECGSIVQIFNSFELIYDSTANTLDRPFLKKKQKLYKRIFPKCDILGWYSTGRDVQETDMQIHKALMDINERPIYVLVNPQSNNAQKDLPITIYESELYIMDGVPSLTFVRSNCTIETVEAERISVDPVAPSDKGSAPTQLAAQLMGIHSALKMLNARVDVLHHLLMGMREGCFTYLGSRFNPWWYSQYA